MILYSGLCDPGCVREENEDRILVEPGLGLFVVADGMGGHRHGELAAELAISAIRYYLESTQNRADVTWPFGYNFNWSLNANRLATGVRLANRHVWKKAEEAPEYAGMGSTIAALLVEGDEAAVANVGDSRVYVFRNSQLRQLSTDDTWLNAVMERDAAGQARVLKHPMRNVLTQAAGSRDDIDVHVCDVALQDGDLLVLSSDGLHNVVTDEGMRAILASGRPVAELCSRLVEAGRAAGAPDNLAGIVVAYQAEGARNA